ncbi:MAG: type IA DNA topoisomerase [Methanobacteriota archaeon]|nr:MAG: type IA DNA topoisomerase [Euryarchaeota archaeon]
MLIVVESVTKAKMIVSAFKSVGELEGKRIIATMGSIWDTGSVKDDKPHVTSSMLPSMNVAKNGRVLTALSEAAARHTELCLGVDPDEEGMAIAADIVNFVRGVNPGIDVSVFHLDIMDEKRILDAIGKRKPWSDEHSKMALLGNIRRGADRLVGWLNKGKTGRVTTLVCAALVDKVAGELDDQHWKSMNGHKKPWNTRELLHAGIKMGLTSEDAGKALQKLYEKGEITYPRTNGRKIPGEYAEKIRMAARSGGYMMFNLGEQVITDDFSHDHPAVIPLGQADMFNDGDPESVMKSVLWRRWLSIGNVMTPKIMSVQTPESALYGDVLGAMAGTGAGRPSTYSRIAQKFVEIYGDVDDFNRLRIGQTLDFATVSPEDCLALTDAMFGRSGMDANRIMDVVNRLASSNHVPFDREREFDFGDADIDPRYLQGINTSLSSGMDF